MATKQDNVAARRVTLAKMSAQLKVWSTRLDELVSRSIVAGALPGDGYRVRVDGLRALHGTVLARLGAYTSANGQAEPWATFRTEIADDWTALSNGIKELTR
jgi:hypothetical protein